MWNCPHFSLFLAGEFFRIKNGSWWMFAAENVSGSSAISIITSELMVVCTYCIIYVRMDSLHSGWLTIEIVIEKTILLGILILCFSGTLERTKLILEQKKLSQMIRALCDWFGWSLTRRFLFFSFNFSFYYISFLENGILTIVIINSKPQSWRFIHNCNGWMCFEGILIWYPNEFIVSLKISMKWWWW